MLEAVKSSSPHLSTSCLCSQLLAGIQALGTQYLPPPASLTQLDRTTLLARATASLPEYPTSPYKVNVWACQIQFLHHYLQTAFS